MTETIKVRVGTDVDKIATELAQAFAPHRIWLVGGSVRDALLGRDSNDADFCTDALPTESEPILRTWGTQFWDPGASYGTVCAMKDGVRVEVTTLRKDTYDPDSRKPEVEFGTDIWEDLNRRDFRINAMAVEVQPDGNKVFYAHPDSLNDLAGRLLVPPGDPNVSFTDDPLRLIRAARFCAQLDFRVDFETFSGMTETARQISKVAVERITAELDKMLMQPYSYRGASLLEATEVLPHFLPEAKAFHKMDALPPVLEVSWAAWLFEAGPEGAKEALKRLKHNGYLIRTVPRLIALANQFLARGQAWDRPQVRKFVWDCGDLFEQAIELIDVLTDTEPFGAIWGELEADGDLDDLKQPLSGEDIMDWLDIPAGPEIGQAINWLQNARLEVGPMTTVQAYAELARWQAGR